MKKRLSGFFMYQAGLLLLASALLVSFCFLVVGYALRCDLMHSAFLKALVNNSDSIVIARYRGCELKRRIIHVNAGGADIMIAMHEVVDASS